MASEIKNDVNRQSVEYYENEGPVRRCPTHPNLLDNLEGLKTVFDLAKHSFSIHADKRCFGKRIQLPDRSWSDYIFRTYSEAWRDIQNFSLSLRKLGLKKGDFLGIYSINREEWPIAALACTLQGIIIVPLYDTLGPNAIEYIINHANLSVVVCSGKTFNSLSEASHKCPSLQKVILMDSIPVSQKEKASSNLEFFTMNELIKEGSKCEYKEETISPNDLFIIMYTSGTTGNPKGVMITHRNIISATAGLYIGAPESDEVVHISYLPLAHIYELTILLTVLYRGGAIGFWRGDINGLIEDVQTLKPNMFIGVPRVFNRVYDKVMGELNQSGFLKQMIFNYAFSSKKAALSNGQDSPLWNRLVFKKIKDALGGRVEMIGSGSAPLGKEVQEFLRVATGANVIQGYGLTETCAALTKQLMEDQDTAGHVGPPLPCCEVKLVDVPEMGYTSSKNPQRGEICVRGPNVFIGYYKDEEKTREVLEPNGWFHTGDIGEWLPNGSLKIIDRKKNILKLAQGEYVALEMIETILLRSKYVLQLLIYGSSLKDYLVAVVVPDPETLIPWAKSVGIKDLSIQSLCKREDVKNLIYRDLVQTGTSAKLSGFQLPRQLYLEPEQWTVENECLTPSMKVKRQNLHEKYSEVIEQLYKLPRLDKMQSKL